jgi:hypothetical protein
MLQKFIQLAPIQPYSAAGWAVIDLDSMSFTHPQFACTYWAFYGLILYRRLKGLITISNSEAVVNALFVGRNFDTLVPGVTKIFVIDR